MVIESKCINRQIIITTHSPYFVPLTALVNGGGLIRTYKDNIGNIKGLSEATLEKLVEWGWVKSCVDIFKLTPEEHGIRWAEKPGFGVKSVANILNAIQESRNCKLDKFIAALGIPLIGTKASKDLACRFKSWAEFIKAISTNFKFYELPNFGIEMHNAIMGFDYAEALQLATNYLDIANVEPETAEASLEGKTFVKEIYVPNRVVNFVVK